MCVRTFAQGQVGLHAQASQGCFELVGSIGQKAFLRCDGVFEPHQQVIHRSGHGGYFQRNLLNVQWAHVVTAARADTRFELMQGLDGLRQCQPDQEDRQRQDDELRQHDTLDDLGGQYGAFFQGFGHLNQAQLRFGGVCLDPGVGDLDVGAFEHIVPQADIARHDHFALGGQRQITFAADKFAAQAQHLVVNGVLIVGAQQFTRWLGQVDLHATALHCDQLRQCTDVVFQRPVKRFAGNALCHQPGQDQTHRPQQQQRGEHPVQDFTKQRALFAMEELKRQNLLGDFF